MKKFCCLINNYTSYKFPLTSLKFHYRIMGRVAKYVRYDSGTRDLNIIYFQYNSEIIHSKKLFKLHFFYFII